MRKIIALTVFTLLSCSTFADESHGWALVYKVREVNPSVMTAVYCSDMRADCNTVYMEVERTEWFPTKHAAIDRMNGIGTFTGLTPPGSMKPENFVGLFEARRVSTRWVKVGTHKETVTEQHEKLVDTMEWQP